MCAFYLRKCSCSLCVHTARPSLPVWMIGIYAKIWQAKNTPHFIFQSLSNLNIQKTENFEPSATLLLKEGKCSTKSVRPKLWPRKIARTVSISTLESLYLSTSCLNTDVTLAGAGTKSSLESVTGSLHPHRSNKLKFDACRLNWVQDALALIHLPLVPAFPLVPHNNTRRIHNSNELLLPQLSLIFFLCWHCTHFTRMFNLKLFRLGLF